MMVVRPSSFGGVGEPLRPSRRRRFDGCNNDHRDPQRAGDCPCADLANDRAERYVDACAWGTAEECHASAQRCRDAGEGYGCKLHRVYVRAVW